MNQADFDVPGRMEMSQEEAAMPYTPEPDQRPAVAIKQKYEGRLMALNGVEGIGIGQDPIGNLAIVVFVRDQEVSGLIPKELDGVPVKVQVTGPIDALKRR